MTKSSNRYAVAAVAILMLCGCVSNSEFMPLGGVAHQPKPKGTEVQILNDAPAKAYDVIALVTARDATLKKAVKRLKEQGRLAGADALIEFKQERKYSGDYWADRYFVEAKAVVFRP